MEKYKGHVIHVKSAVKKRFQPLPIFHLCLSEGATKRLGSKNLPFVMSRAGSNQRANCTVFCRSLLYEAAPLGCSAKNKDLNNTGPSIY